MSDKKLVSYHVRVEPRSPGDYGFASIGGLPFPLEAQKRACEQIAEQIRRYVDGIPSGLAGTLRGVTVEPDYE